MEISNVQIINIYLNAANPTSLDTKSALMNIQNCNKVALSNVSILNTSVPMIGSISECQTVFLSSVLLSNSNQNTGSNAYE